MGLKSGRDKYKPSVYVDKESFKFDSTDPFDMDTRAAANEIALRGDPEGAIEYLVFASSMHTVTPVKVPQITFSKKGSDDKVVSKNDKVMIDALLKSGYKIS